MSVPKRSREAAFTVPRRRVLGSLAALSLAAGVLTACGSSGGVPTLTWYINPDSGGQAAIAKNCSTDQYKIATQVLPQDATQQRVQLSRRLAAHDSGIDLMSLDPPFTAEMSNAGFLAPIPQDVQSQLQQQSIKGAVAAGTWNGKLVVFPFWSNTQVLWYRKSFVDKTGIDMNKPVTWDQIIDAAAKNGGKVAVQANKYEGYAVWINALISGAGGNIISDADKGANATIDINSPAGDDAAAIINQSLPTPSAAAAGPVGVERGHRRIDVRLACRLVHGELDVHLPQLRLDPAGRREGHRVHPIPGVGGREAFPPAVRRHRHRGQRLLQPRERRDQGRPVPGQPEEPGHQRRDHRQHAGERRRAYSVLPGSRSSTHPRCWPSSSRVSTLRRTAAELAVLERHLQRHPEHLAPAGLGQLRHPGEVRDRSSSRSFTGKALLQ